MDNLRVWQFLSAALTLSLLISWSYFQFASMLNDSAMEALSHHRTEIRRLDNQVVLLSSQINDLKSHHRILSERTESYNQQRLRDIEQLNARLPAPRPIR